MHFSLESRCAPCIEKDQQCSVKAGSLVCEQCFPSTHTSCLFTRLRPQLVRLPDLQPSELKQSDQHFRVKCPRGCDGGRELRLDDMVLHWQITHLKPRSRRCGSCGKGFSGSMQLLKHTYKEKKCRTSRPTREELNKLRDDFLKEVAKGEGVLQEQASLGQGETSCGGNAEFPQECTGNVPVSQMFPPGKCISIPSPIKTLRDWL
ncbi:hypothetical protein, variant [Cladophialophora immunda]|uniref:C2H2-type domain-containing protein n=1 Tax=Cladophialophora immunda TaxID=569365 RepID=A0A0D2BS31_9EURO|nr:hypothetical protein, variant [Cladophialophora immunda]KIW21868.1 hypothetical protein, variant [Cladophialophora immunda]